MSDAALLYQFETVADRSGDWHRDAAWRRKRLYWEASYSRTSTLGQEQTVQVRLRHDVFIDKMAIHHVAGQLSSAVVLDEVYRERRSRPKWRRHQR